MLMDQLVGRAEELAFLRDRLADARGGAGHLVVVTGPAGIGKTRLVEELVAAADMVVGWGAAVDDAGMPALWPWTRALRHLPAPRAALASLAAGATQSELASADDAAAVTFAADTAVVDALDAEARSGTGLLVVLDDLQWADQSTRRLLERLAAEVRRMPVLVVCTSRDTIGDSTQALPASRATAVLNLRPLTAAESAILLTAAVTGTDPGQVRRGAELSGGSPLYLRTLTRVAAPQLRGTSAWSEVGEQPELRHLILTALRATGEDAARAVGALSVLGPDADPDLLARVLGIDSTADALERIQPAVPAGLVEVLPTAGGRVRFAHALVRDAAYASLTPGQRKALHRRTAEVLAPLAVVRDEQAGAVAHHWHRAGEPGRAVEWAIRAADTARAAAAYEDAISYLTLALEVRDRDLEPGLGIDRAELLLDLARAQYLASQIVESAQTCRLAATEGERTGRPEVVARAALVVQGVGHPEVNVALDELCRRALTTVDRDNHALRARLEAQLACALVETDDLAEAAIWSRHALDSAALSGDANAELDAIRARATLVWKGTLDDELVRLGRRAIELSATVERPLAKLWAYGWLADHAVHSADMAAARSEVAAMQGLAERTGLPLVRWYLLRFQSTLAAFVGNFEAYRGYSEQAAEIAGSFRDRSVQYTRLGQQIMVALLRGDPAEIPPMWTEVYDDVADLPLIGQVSVAAAMLVTGDRDGALALYRRVLEMATSDRGRYTGASLVYLVELAQELGNPEECRMVRRLVIDHCGHSPVVGGGTVFYAGAVARMLGELDLGCGEPVAAVEHFEEGLRVDATVSTSPYVARGRLGLARALHATGERTRAVQLARTAAAEARRLDMPGLLRRADEFLAAASAQARTEDPLTDREREVVELVAAGLSNRDTATRLFLSERTVESHIRRVLAKTNLTSRTELTRWYVQRSGRRSDGDGSDH